MNENDVQNEISYETPNDVSAEAAENIENTNAEPISEQTDASPEIKEENTEICDREAAMLMSHPMFVHFARGRQGDFHEILASFRAMLGASHETDARETAAKMTPAMTQTVSDVALTERQRAIARAAGMSYREYYRILNG